MNEINFGGFVLIASLLVIVPCSYGFALGFGAFLAVVAILSLPAWLYWLVVASRPHVVGVWELHRFGSKLVYTEVA